MKIVQTAERISHVEASDNVIFQRSIFAYYEAAKLITGSLLEVGTGMGYGMEILAEKVDQYYAIDKYSSEIVDKNKENPNFHFYQTNVPPFTGIDDNSVDFAVSFQVIEHIKKDSKFVEEIYRVLKPGGKAIITTPNIKMSLTRNPWHIREYTWQQLESLFSNFFDNVDIKGVFGNEKTLEYYEKNKASVAKFKKLDIFNMEQWLPRQLLQIPYDILNRRNRNKLLEKSTEEVNSITKDDYFLQKADDNCYDLFAIATK